MVNITLPPTILNRFLAWSNIDCWVLCNEEKQPVTLHDRFWLIPKNDSDVVPKKYYAGKLLRWKSEPQDHISNIYKIQKYYEATPGYGFGILLGRGNTLCCFDFDHVISRDGKIPEKVDSFLKQLRTFVEISSSGNGLHAFVAVNGETEEYGFDANICDGKFYNFRFIKLTGNIYTDYDLPIRILNHHEYKSIQSVLGAIKALPKPDRTNISYTGDRDCDWPKILSDANIRYETANEYIGKIRKRGEQSHSVDYSCRIQCPNIISHTDYQKRLNQFNPDVAILTLWDDGLTSVVCNHNHCDGKTYRPNLLQMLWVQIKESRAKRAKQLLTMAGVRF